LKIGLFGGSFDPIHIGHLMVAEQMLYELQLDKILFIPAQINPFKTQTPPIKAKHRVKMTQLAIQNNSQFLLNTLEIKSPPPSYTIDTLLKLKETYPSHTQFFLLAGSDILENFKNWKEWKKIIQNTKIAIFLREHHHNAKELQQQYPFIILPHSFLIPFSSSQIRSWIAQKKPFRYTLPPKVYDYIQKNKLYQIANSDDGLSYHKI